MGCPRDQQWVSEGILHVKQGTDNKSNDGIAFQSIQEEEVSLES